MMHISDPLKLCERGQALSMPPRLLSEESRVPHMQEHRQCTATLQQPNSSRAWSQDLYQAKKQLWLYSCEWKFYFRDG